MDLSLAVAAQPDFVLYEIIIETVGVFVCLSNRRNCWLHACAKGRTSDFACSIRAERVPDAGHSYALLAIAGRN